MPHAFPLSSESRLERYGDCCRQTCVTATNTQLVTVSREAFQAAAEAAAVESFECARLQELLYKPCPTRSPDDVTEIAHRLRGFKYFTGMDPSQVSQLAAVAGACPCPRYVSIAKSSCCCVMGDMRLSGQCPRHAWAHTNSAWITRTKGHFANESCRRSILDSSTSAALVSLWIVPEVSLRLY